MSQVIKGTCPACNGSKVREHDWACINCGGQYMFGQATGQVPLRSDGTPCKHEYKGATTGRCLTQYTCKHCNDSHQIDSGD